jgi:hypothetical protein
VRPPHQLRDLVAEMIREHGATFPLATSTRIVMNATVDSPSDSHSPSNYSRHIPRLIKAPSRRG